MLQMKVLFQAHLLACCQRCVMKSRRIKSEQQRNDEDEEVGDEDEVVHTLSELETLLNSLSKRMAMCDMEDFELVSVLIL